MSDDEPGLGVGFPALLPKPAASDSVGYTNGSAAQITSNSDQCLGETLRIQT